MLDVGLFLRLDGLGIAGSITYHSASYRVARLKHQAYTCPLHPFGRDDLVSPVALYLHKYSMICRSALYIWLRHLGACDPELELFVPLR